MRMNRQVICCACLTLGGFVIGCAETQQKEGLADPPVVQGPPVEKSAPSGEKVTPEMPSSAGPVDTDAPEEFSTTESGLKYRIRRKGNENQPSASNTVKVNYHGWLDDGTVFDSSYERGEPIEFGLRQVIPGWTEGMQLVGEGGMIELEIPSNLGYGPGGQGPIPPNATLHFLVELIEIK